MSFITILHQLGENIFSSFGLFETLLILEMTFFNARSERLLIEVKPYTVTKDD